MYSIWQLWGSQGSSWSLALYRLFSKEYVDPSAKSTDNPLKVLSNSKAQGYGYKTQKNKAKERIVSEGRER